MQLFNFIPLVLITKIFHNWNLLRDIQKCSMLNIPSIYKYTFKNYVLYNSFMDVKKIAEHVIDIWYISTLSLKNKSGDKRGGKWGGSINKNKKEEKKTRRERERKEK